MSRQFTKATRIFALLLVFMLLAGNTAFAANIVSPAENSIVVADSLLISVKLNDQNPVTITVYKEQLESRTEVTRTAGTTYSDSSFSDFDASSLTADDMALSSSGNRTDEDGQPLLFSSGDEIPEFHDSVFASPVSYTNPTAGIGFYTKKLVNVKPGLYKVRVETLDDDRNVLEAEVSYAAVQEKKEEKQGIFTIGQNSALQFLQNLIKNLFK